MAVATPLAPSAPAALHIAIPASAWDSLPLRIRPASPIGDDELFELCVANRELRIERTADGELLVMSPTGSDTSRLNADLVIQLGIWAKRDGTGVVFDSNGGFTLPNGAMRAPDAAWVRKDRWDALAPADRRKFAHVAPDFVIELRSPSDKLADVQSKLAEYIACGVRLGLLIDPIERAVHVYRGLDVQVLRDVAHVDASPELPGFVLDLQVAFGE